MEARHFASLLLHLGWFHWSMQVKRSFLGFSVKSVISPSGVAFRIPKSDASLSATGMVATVISAPFSIWLLIICLEIHLVQLVAGKDQYIFKIVLVKGRRVIAVRHLPYPGTFPEGLSGSLFSRQDIHKALLNAFEVIRVLMLVE